MTPAQREAAWEGLVTASVYLDDLIALEKAGEPTGFKPEVLTANRRAVQRAMDLLAPQE